MKLLSIDVCRKFSISRILIILIVLLCSSTSVFSQKKTYGLLKKVSGNDENGYVLFSPLNCDTIFLINKCGQIVHQWQSVHPPGMSLYLQPNGHLIKAGTYTDTFFGVAGGRGGIIEEFDWNNQLIWRYKIFNDSLCQHHDIKPLPNGNILVLAWHSISKQKALALGRKTSNFGVNQTDLWGERIIELKPIGKDSAEIVWQWDLFDHLIQDVDTAYPNFGQINQHPEKVDINYAINLRTNDWIHANGIDYNPELDQIIISCHNFSEFWIIDHSTTLSEARGSSGGNIGKGGDLLYRWGNPQAYKAGTSSDRKLFRQHHAYWIPNGLKDSGCVMLFNNGLERDTAYSSVEIIKTPVQSNGSYLSGTPYLPTNPIWIYKDSIPTNFYSAIISGAERMPNGNTMICSGVQGLFFEVTPQGKTVWKYKNPQSGNTLLSDGANNNNPVFRCTFYPSNYGAFKNRNLSGGRVLEKNSLTYSCNYEYNPPLIKQLFPANKSQGILPDSTLRIEYSEAILKSTGNIDVFSNGILLESISASSDLVHVKGNTLVIKHLKKFPFNSRISIKVSANIIRDSSFNFYTTILDSSKWNFYIRKSNPTLIGITPDSGEMNVKVDVKPSAFFESKIYKANSGNITIYENSVLKEVIPISSSQVNVIANYIAITPKVPFGFGSKISIVLDSCIRDTFGYKNKPIRLNAWSFNTVTQPQIVKVIPQKASEGIDKTTDLVVQFDRVLINDSIKNIEIFENGIRKYLLATNNAAVTNSGNYITIQPNGGFKSGSRIAINFPSNAYKDQNGTYFNGIDSSNWYFTIQSNSNINKIDREQIQLYPNPIIDWCILESEIKLMQIELMDMSGRIYQLPIEKLTEKTYKLNLEQFENGAYVVRLNSEIVIKILKL